jgi:hypothetical protein
MTQVFSIKQRIPATNRPKRRLIMLIYLAKFSFIALRRGAENLVECAGAIEDTDVDKSQS